MSSRKRKHPFEKTDDGSEEEMVWSDEEGMEIDGIYIPPPAKSFAAVNSNRRLIIRKITNNFFKSYARNQVLGPFSKCFNAIVGPNGSGKSNVIDSMLFVFGYRASKIRCKKTSVLIHNSEIFPNVQSCTVAVHFCEIIDKDGKDYEIVPDSEFVISRTANKDNSSYYLLNNKKVQFKEIAKLLRKHGIDLDHNRFLILQGEVEEIAMMKCKGTNENETGMLEYLEDIIGTSRYKKPLEQLNERIEQLSVVRLEKLNRLKLIEKELEELKGPMEEAVGFLKTENKITTCRNIIYQKNIFELEEKIVSIEEEKSEITESCNNLVDRLTTLSEEKSQKEAALKQEVAKYNKLEQRKEQMKEAFNAADKKDMQLQADMTQMNTNRKKYKEQLAEEKKKLAQLEKVPEENKKTIAECEKKEQELTASKEKLEEQKSKVLASIRKETKHLQEKKQELELELGNLRKSVDKSKAAYDLAESELKIACSSEEKEKNKLEELKHSVKETESTIKQRTVEVSELKRKIPLTEKSLNETLNELQEVRHETDRITNEIKSKRTELVEIQNSMQMSKSRGAVLDSLMRQKREGNCPGLYGRLGDLGAIDQKYDVAVSTACGPLDNIVVDTVTTAQWCIEFLKKHNIGRATFIALDKQEYLRELANSKIRTPENVPRLFDLIKVQDETVKTAFYFALRDTLVANDLDQASRIAYGAQRYRVVTLRGDLIETSGTMSGGGRSVLRGRMGQSVVATSFNPRDIEKLENDIGNLDERFGTLKQRQVTLERQANTLQPELQKMKIDYEKFVKELESLNEQLPSLTQQLRKQENVVKATKSDPEKVKKLTDTVNEKKIDYEEALAATQDVQVRVDELTDEIKEKSTGRMKTIEKQISEITKTMDKCKAEITRLRVAITTSERNAKKSAQKIENLEQNITNAENSMRQMKAERDTIEDDGQKLLKCIEEITEQIANGEEQYADLKDEVTKLTKEENKLKLNKVDIDQNLKTIKEKLSESQAALHQWNTKLSQLKLHDIPNESDELKKYTQEEIRSLNTEETELQLQTAINSIKSARPNLNVIEEYRRGQEIYMERLEDLDKVTSKRNEIKNAHDKVKTRRKDEFMVGYNRIKLKLKEMYQMITLGGDADFEIVDSFDPFAEGIQFNVRPPKKSWKMISNLSGGEKTLSSLSLVFALHYYKPSPLYVMDEIDAALDFKNVSIVGNYIKERTKNAQFIIISLRSNMFELCDNLIGIFKIFNCTQSVTIDPNAFDDKESQIAPVTTQKVSTQKKHNEQKEKEKKNDENEQQEECMQQESTETKRPEEEQEAMLEDSDDYSVTPPIFRLFD